MFEENFSLAKYYYSRKRINGIDQRNIIMNYEKKPDENIILIG